MERQRHADQLTAVGITLVGVVLSIATTVGLGISGPWWVRLLAGLGALLGLLAAIKLGTSSERGPLARFAKWVTNAPGS